MSIIKEEEDEQSFANKPRVLINDESSQYGDYGDNAFEEAYQNHLEGQTTEFFEDNFQYDDNFVRTPTIVPGKGQTNNHGIFLELGSREEGSTVSKLSRYCRSDAILESEQYEGYLEKKSPKLLVGWQSRYFVLKERKLYYYKKKELTDKPKGIFNFEMVEVTIKPNVHKKYFKLLMKGVSRVFKFRCKSVDDLNIWIYRLMKTVERSRGYMLKLGIDEKQLSLKSWRFDRISEEQFLRQADIGDVLLFRGNNFGAKITRGFTQSKFGKTIDNKLHSLVDHVALILKFDAEPDELFFLDATSNLIQQCSYSLVFRHLYCDRSEDFLMKLETFIRTVVGNRFEISLKKLFFQRKTVAQDMDKRQFFCSELVTKSYKELGLVETEKSSCRFFPHDFSKDGKIAMTGDNKLGDEMLIEFDEEQIKKDYDQFLVTQQVLLNQLDQTAINSESVQTNSVIQQNQ
ncbi:ph domain-containing protein [Stylonychia lemnae]|uniref:Ph domain-containing protein n=1 Tax=Stylonychia lemnae TaxID=5949 RepID=A0A078B358_STYLE|nr:ph domain-containing protein [Stylonychia lemnae]|eukprot:CDW88955.1 ph domain-containing protein [Stylonychia lemnae]